MIQANQRLELLNSPKGYQFIEVSRTKIWTPIRIPRIIQNNDNDIREFLQFPIQESKFVRSRNNGITLKRDYDQTAFMVSIKKGFNGKAFILSISGGEIFEKINEKQRLLALINSDKSYVEIEWTCTGEKKGLWTTIIKPDGIMLTTPVKTSVAA